jgi:hypothetical protein
LEDDEGLESDDFSRLYPSKQNFGQKLKRTFAIRPIRDDRDHYERPEKDRKIWSLTGALNGGLRAMKLKGELSPQSEDWCRPSAVQYPYAGWRRAAAIRHWGSDEDLALDTGFGVDPELRYSQPIPRPAPMAVPLRTHKVKEDIKGNYTSNRTKWETQLDISSAKPEVAEMTKRQQTKLSFFDVGGLLKES